jgi:hypothetical protein
MQMKLYPCLWLLLALPAAAQAFDYEKLSGMMADPEKMQQEAEKMAKAVAEATKCMNSEDFKKLQAEGQAVGAKIDSLCAQGDRKGAEQAAAEYSKKLLTSEEFKNMQKCSEQLLAGMPQSFIEAGKANAAETGSDNKPPPHICDMEHFHGDM